MAESEDDSSKTEEPSAKKLEEARKKGQIPASRELNHFFMMLAFLFFVLFMAPKMARDSLTFLTPFIGSIDHFDMSGGGLIATFRHIILGGLLLLALPLLLTVVAAIAPAILQRKISFSAESITPKLSKISPLAGVGRLFGLKAMIEFAKNLLKVIAVGVISAMVVIPYRDELPQLLHSANRMTMLEYTQSISGKVLTAICIFLFLLSIVDYLYQRFTLLKSLRMSKHELKEEYRQQEGDPQVKQRLRQIRRDRAKSRMMANVPKADVIVTNPTHYAIALKYDAATMQAPVLLAKGADDVAARIREKATAHKIPIIRNPPLARILYDTTDIDDEIPIEHYQAVAKIIGYVYRLKGKTAQGTAANAAPKKGNFPTLRKK
ncbi:MAG: flagellar biosynthesis protein FlhB [Alphaproteobacteria bacterium]|nr:flagellar biosynthesis protein FlhB [Alphaproteobacteria bacterium]